MRNEQRERHGASQLAAVPARAKQAGEARGPEKWAYAEASIWTDRMLAALENGVKGGKWYSLAEGRSRPCCLFDKVHHPVILAAAWKRVAANKGAAGVDGQSIAKFKGRAETHLAELEQGIKEGSYRPLPVKRVEIPKADGKKRPLGIPAVKDRIVQMAVKMAIEPVFENEFLETSYGFRPGQGCKDALREVDRLLKDGYVWVVDADLKAYFDSIPQDRLMTRLEERISDGRLLALIDSFLRQDVMHGLERWTPAAGTPQGAVISPLLANIYLHPLDVAMRDRGVKMVRYADDFVLLCQTAAEAQAALEVVKAWTEENGLTLHPDKTRMGNCLVKGQGFDFLGYRFEAGRRFVRKKSLKALYDKVRAKTPRNSGWSLEAVIAGCVPAWNKAPVGGVIGVQAGPLRR